MIVPWTTSRTTFEILLCLGQLRKVQGAAKGPDEDFEIQYLLGFRQRLLRRNQPKRSQDVPSWRWCAVDDVRVNAKGYR